MGNSSRERDRELLIPVADSSINHDDSAKPTPSISSSHHSGREVVLYISFVFSVDLSGFSYNFNGYLSFFLVFVKLGIN